MVIGFRHSPKSLRPTGAPRWFVSGQTATPGPGYKCNRCNQIGGIEGKSHYIRDCPQGKANESNNVKRSTGIPRSFLQPATADTPGAKINPQGKLL